MIHGNRRSIEAKRDACGIWSIIDSQMVTEILATSGIDAIFFDLEHGQFSIPALANSIRVASPYCAPFVRIPKVDKELTQRVLDFGAAGIIVPQVTSAKEVADACAAIDLAPVGCRGFNPFTRAGNYSGDASSPAYQRGFATVIPIIETFAAVQSIESIVSIDGVGIVYIGVYDLSCSAGVPGKVDHPRVLEAVRTIKAAVKSAGKRVAYMVDRFGCDDDGQDCLQILKPDSFMLRDAIASRLTGATKK